MFVKEDSKMIELEEWQSSDLTDEELEEITTAYYDNEIKVFLGIFFTVLEDKHIYWVQWGKYKGDTIIYQCRDDWGLIYGSIIWEKEIMRK